MVFKKPPFGRDKLHLVRYADDFIVIGKTKELLENVALPIIQKFLEDRGLSLKWEKTRIVSIDQGFDFLGFNLREYVDSTRAKGYKKGIFLIKPAADRIKGLRKKIKDLVKKHRNLPTHVLITKLNQVLRGWAEHYRAVTSKKVFSAIGQYVFKCIWNMLCKKHPNMPRRMLKHKYFMSREGNNWVFFGKDQNNRIITLFQMGWVIIKRHVMCKSLNYFLLPALWEGENQEYFNKRNASLVKVSSLLNTNQSKLANKQKGLCPVCNAPLLNGEALEVHHVRSRKDGGSDALSNLLLLHKICHLQVTHCKNPVLLAAFKQKGIIK